MSEITLDTLVHILAALASSRTNNVEVIERNITSSFLQNQFSIELVNKKMVLFDKYYRKYIKLIKQGTKKEQILEIAYGLVSEVSQSLTYRHRIFILVNLVEFSAYLKVYLINEIAYKEYFLSVSKIGEILNIKPETVNICTSFSKGEYHMISLNSELLVISNTQIPFSEGVNNLILENFNGLCYVIFIHNDFYLLRYEGKDIVYIDNTPIVNKKTYFFTKTTSLRSKNSELVYFHDLSKYFYSGKEFSHFEYSANNISYQFPGSQKGISELNLFCESNELVGILGSSGAGKTTLLKLLRGDLPLKTGEISINGANKLDKKITGYIPQDDLLLKELTVFENLYFSAKLAFNEDNSHALERRVHDLLESFGLYEIKDLQIGPLNKKLISGGERRRLNIALEIIRNPSILFADEPTSGLSSSDAANVIYYLRQYALTGKLVFINIHQPSNEIFYSFNKILIIDQGGYPIYYGKPGEALDYFRGISHTIENKSIEKNRSISEIIFTIIEETKTDTIGNKTRKRITEPKTWYKDFIKEIKSTNQKLENNELTAPSNNYSIPGVYEQFRTYLTRTVKRLWSDYQFRALALSIMPLLSFVLSLLCREKVLNGNGSYEYIFYENGNIASFLFLSTIVAVFVGLIISAEEIIKEKKIWIRERDLGNSKLAYFGSKAIVFSGISLIQTLLYSLFAYLILKLTGNFFIFWMILFLTAVLSNIIGLILSSSFRSVASIYIMVPIIMVPQILLSGVVVTYEKLNPIFKNERFVPILGDLMPTRWSYEALVINQFKNNKYQREFFNLEQQRSRLSYQSMILLPQLESVINQELLAIDKKDYDVSASLNSELILNELKKQKPDCSSAYISDSTPFSAKHLRKVLECITHRKYNISNSLANLAIEKDRLIDSLGGALAIRELRNKYGNKSIDNLVLNRNSAEQIVRYKNNYIQKIDPIYQLPQNLIGRAHYYSSGKKIIKAFYSTILYNNVIIICIILLLFLILLKDSFIVKNN